MPRFPLPPGGAQSDGTAGTDLRIGAIAQRITAMLMNRLAHDVTSTQSNGRAAPSVLPMTVEGIPIRGEWLPVRWSL